MRQQHTVLATEKTELESSCEQLAQQAEDLRIEKARLEENKARLKQNGTRRGREPGSSMKRSEASGNRSMNFAPSAASARSKRRATMRIAIICARPASRN